MIKLIQLLREILTEIGFSSDGYFVNRKTGQYFSVRPSTHEEWAMQHYDQLGLLSPQDGAAASDPIWWARQHPEWLRASMSGDHISFDIRFPITARDIDIVKDFTMDAGIKFDSILFVDPISKKNKWSQYEDFVLARSERDLFDG